MRKIGLSGLSFVLSFALLSCKEENQVTLAEANTLQVGSQWVAGSDLEKLGYQLYFDKRLSKDNSVSCNSCHNIVNGGNGTDSASVSTGISGLLGGRNSPTVWNAKSLSVQFWDGRAKDLAEQAKGPIINPVEMGMVNHDAAIDKIKDIPGYQNLFALVFPEDTNPINIDNLAEAIAAFESTLVSSQSPYDKGELSSQASRGKELFNSVGCVSCHSGSSFAGPELPVGTGFYMKFPTFNYPNMESKYDFSSDLGRYELTKQDSDRNMWRVPSLLNVSKTAPYFHNGKVNSLKEAVKIMGKTQLNRDLSSSELDSLVAFLKSLEGEVPMITEPKAFE